MDDANSAADLRIVDGLLEPIVGKSFFQFRMGTCLHLDVGTFLITIEAPLTVVRGGTTWTSEPVGVPTAAALLPLISRTVTSIKAGADGTLAIGLGDAILSVPPVGRYEAWQATNDDDGEVLVVCVAGGVLSYPI